MKEKRSSFWVGGAVLFAAATYSIVLRLIKPRFDLSAWLLFGFTQVAFLLLALQVVAASKKSQSVVTDTSLAVVTAVYFLLQFIFGGIVCMCFDGLPIIPVIVSETVLLTVYLVLAFVVFGAQSHSAAQDQNDQLAIRKHMLLENAVRGMAEQETNSELKAALENLAEEIHYSDAVLSPGLADLEERISQNISALQDDLNDDKTDPAQRIALIQRLLKERERTAAVLKQ